MKVYVKPQKGLSRAMDRVAKALVVSTPEVEEVEREEDAEFVLIHVIGYPETVQAVERCLERKQKFGIAQYCLRTTQKPHIISWLPLWEKAEVVWSYYDLIRLAEEDKLYFNTVNFYKSPLGVDGSVFYPRNEHRDYKIATSGYVAKSESVNEVAAACKALGVNQFHLGPNDLGLGKHVTCALDITDDQLAQWYSRCEYVSGLRRVEGFELPAAEGLLCGARPIVFNAPHYIDWFREHAIFIDEADETSLSTQLVQELFSAAPPVTVEERAAAADRFSWPTIARGFWSAVGVLAPPKSLHRPSPPAPVARKPRVLYVGDAGVSSGFARAAERGILAEVHKHYDVTALGINFLGDPCGLPYPVYPCHDYYGGDAFGTYRLPKLAAKIKPDVIIIQQDPWNFPAYFERLKNAKIDVPVIGSVAVDGKNCRGRALRGLSLAAFWTEFGRDEAVNGGYEGPTAVIPLGVDLAIYHPVDKKEARRLCKLDSGKYADAFIVGNINRNQPRKRLDLTIQYFAEWVKTYNVDNAYLFLHVAPTGDRGYDVEQLMNYYGLLDRLIVSNPEIGKGYSEEHLNYIYNTFDVQVSTTQGEGWGLTTLEGMACGIPQIVPDWSGLGSWAWAAMQIPCIRENIVTPDNINAIGGTPSSLAFIESLHNVYSNDGIRKELTRSGLALAVQPEYRWENIAQSWLTLVNDFMSKRYGSQVHIA